ncbi:MAG TPA: AI-2E family transporter [Candidatus Kapabacteria bacterium]|nr:AI-2E family transporter [Candidatus Kapabacteria bacterium]
MEVEHVVAAEHNIKSEMSLSRKTLIIMTAAVGFLLFLALLWYGVNILLLAFAGILLAIFLCGLAAYVANWTGLKHGMSLLITALALIGILIGAGYALAPGIAEQSNELAEQLPKSIDNLRQYIGKYEWGKQLLESIPKVGEMVGNPMGLLPKVSGVLSSTAAAIMNFLIVIAIGIYFAIEPGLYRRGFIKLLPLADRRRAHEVIDATGNTLWWWIIGVLISMGTIGILTTIGLWILGIPLAPTLGLLTGILAFIPNFGPIISAIPPMLLGLMISPMDAVYVLLLYILVQAIESNIVTPQVQKRTVSMPPVIGMVGQLLFGVFFGFLGLLLATPLVAAILVIVKMLYVEDVLGDREDEAKGVTPSTKGASTDSLVEKGPLSKH